MTDETLLDEEAAVAKVKVESIVPKIILEQLRDEFPRETHETKTMDDGWKQTGIKPAYITERLNRVLGIEGWEAEELEVREKDSHIATKVKLTIFLITKTGDGTLNRIPVASRSQWGNARMHGKEYGDALKAAFTNGLCKAASLFDIAHDAYKGLLPPVESVDDIIDEDDAAEHDKKPAKKATKRATKKSSAKEKTSEAKTSEKPANDGSLRVLRKELLSLFTSKGLTRNELQKMMVQHFDKDESRQLTEEELSQLVELVKALPDESHTETEETKD